MIETILLGGTAFVTSGIAMYFRAETKMTVENHQRDLIYHQAALKVSEDTLESRLKQRLNEWWPTTEVDDDFKKAELMAAMRAMHDAGRSHLPRADGGAPARVSRIQVRNKTPRA